MPKLGMRRSHTKSKKGCGQCKVRRIKCDERHPTCSNCARRDIKCDFSHNSNGEPNESTEHEVEASTTPDQPELAPAVASLDPFSTPNLSSTKKTTDLDVADLELLHHFTTVTCLTMATNPSPEAVAMWQVHTIRLGFKHEFLLRGILAVSALHLAYLNPQQKLSYDLKAQTHQDIALESFQDTLGHVDEHNCHALFAFSCLVVVMAFASSQRASDGLQTDVLHWFHLLRGCSSVLQLHWETLRNSFLSPLLDEVAHTETKATYEVKDADRIMDLLVKCCKPSPEMDRETSQAYALAIHELLRTFTQASVLRGRGQPSILASFVFPSNLSPKYLELLGEQRPEALVILAHYCVLLHWSNEEDEWFMEGWAQYMLGTIRASVGEEWHDSLVWPETVIGTG